MKIKVCAVCGRVMNEDVDSINIAEILLDEDVF